MTAAATLFHNLLSAADADFESGAPTWGAHLNAGAPSVTTSWAFAGSKSLQWTATASGTTQVMTGVYAPVVALKPYVASAILKPGATSRTALMYIAWWSNPTTFISSTTGPSSLVLQSGGPLRVSGVAPAGATLASIIVDVAGAGAGETEQVDVCFLAQSDTQVLVDWVNPPFAPNSQAGQAFYDLTPYVRADIGVSLSRGRQDAVNEVQPGSASFTAYNTNGWITPQNSNSPWYGNIKLGRRAQINMADEVGTWHTRFDGSISELDCDFAINGESHAAVQCADVLAWLGRQDSLSCWTREAVLAGGPALHWTLDDPAGSVTAVESSGNGGPALRPRAHGAGASLTFAGGSGGVEIMADAPSPSTPGPFSSPLPSAHFTTTPGSITANLYTPYPSCQLSAAIPPVSTAAGSNFTIEFWAIFDPSFNYSSVTGETALVSLGDTRSGKNFSVSFTSGAWQLLGYATPPACLGSTGVAGISTSPNAGFTMGASGNPAMPSPGIPTHIVVVGTGASAGGTLAMYVNGVALTPAGGANLTMYKGFTPNWVDVGGAFGGYGGWQGNISLVSLYGYALTPAQISSLYSVSLSGMYRSATSACISRIGTYAELPPFWSNLAASAGIGNADYVDISSQNALATMQQFESAELAGLLYVNAAGQLCFDGRQVRMGCGAPILTLPAGSYDPGMGQKVTDQYLQTKAAIATGATGRSAVVANRAAGSDYGDYSNGTAQSPASLPLLAINPEFAAQGVPAGYGVQLDQVGDAAAWNVNRNDVPPFKAASIVLDLLTNSNPSSPEYVAISAVYGLEINKVVALGNPGVTAMATDPGALDYFAEGINEVKSLTRHTVEIYTSPANISRCWKPGDATYGVLDATAVIGVSQTDDGHALVPKSKVASADPGMPWWPPAYAAAMNNGGLSGYGFVGARDQRGIYGNLQIMQQPPICVAGQSQLAQSFTSGALGTIQWDILYQDTVGGMGILAAWPNWYVILVPGYYELEATVLWATGAGAATGRFAEFVVNQNGCKETPTGPSANFVAGTQRRANTAQVPGTSVSTRMYCGVGTTIGVRASQNAGSAVSTSLTNGGSLMSIKFAGFNLTAG